MCGLSVCCVLTCEHVLSMILRACIVHVILMLVESCKVRHDMPNSMS